MELPLRAFTPPPPGVGVTSGTSGPSLSSSASPLMGPSSKDSSTAAAAAAGGGAAGSSFSEPEDVAAERRRVEGLPDHQGHPIVVRQLNKTYPGQDGQPPKVRGGVSCGGIGGGGGQHSGLSVHACVWGGGARWVGCCQPAVKTLQAAM
jgi:hypothetical protein